MVLNQVNTQACDFLVRTCMIGITCALLLTSVVASPARAGTCSPESKYPGLHDETEKIVKDHFDEELEKHQKWLIEEFWGNIILPSLKAMSAQLTSAAFQQTAIIGGYFDARMQQQVQRRLQRMQAEAVKDYAPSKALCAMGSMTQSLAASESRAKANKLFMAKRSQDRQLGTANVMGANKRYATDSKGRFEQFARRFCVAADMGNGLAPLCRDDVTPEGMNRDISFTRTVAAPLTLNMNFTDSGTPTGDEEDVLALALNLFGHEVFSRPDPEVLARKGNQSKYMDLRAVVAKRSVAENSFYELAAMKSAGTGASAQSMEAMLKRLGLPSSEVKRYLGENPSYNAQMEFLTKKLYQDPQFIVSLVDRPANVERQFAAMQSFNLMQQRDIFDSMLRTEMLLSQLVELELRRAQKEFENEVADWPTD